MKSNKKKILVIGLAVIFVCLGVSIYFYLTREKSVLFCHKSTTTDKYYDYYMSYEVLKGRNYVNIKTKNNVTIKQIMHAELFKEGIDLNEMIQYSADLIDSQLKSKLKDYGDNVKLKIESSIDSIKVQVIYRIDSKTQKQFENLFKINFYKASISEMQEFFESGDMVCEK